MSSMTTAPDRPEQADSAEQTWFDLQAEILVAEVENYLATAAQQRPPSDARPRGRCLRPGPGPPGKRWWWPMVTATSTHHQRLGQATRPSAARTRRPFPTSTQGKAVTPITQDTPTTNTLTLDPPSGPPLGGSHRCAGVA